MPVHKSGVTIPKWRAPSVGSGAKAGATSGGGGGGRGGGGGGGFTQGGIEVANGVIPLVFGYNDIPSALTASRCYRQMPGSVATFVQQGMWLPYAGQIMGMMLGASAPLVSGYVAAEAYVGGYATGAILRWASSNHATLQLPPTAYSFAADTEIDVRLTSSGFSPTTADVEVILIVSFVPGV
jgi:hypothetical protein